MLYIHYNRNTRLPVIITINGESCVFAFVCAMSFNPSCANTPNPPKMIARPECKPASISGMGYSQLAENRITKEKKNIKNAYIGASGPKPRQSMMLFGTDTRIVISLIQRI